MNLEKAKKRVKDFLEFYKLREKTNIDFLFSIKERDIPVEAIYIVLNELDNRIPRKDIKEEIEFIKNLHEKIYYEENVIGILENLLNKE